MGHSMDPANFDVIVGAWLKAFARGEAKEEADGGVVAPPQQRARI